MDTDFFFYVHEGEDYISIATSQDTPPMEMTKAQGKMIMNILQELTDFID